MAYDLFPAVDPQYNFPPEVRGALAKSLELRNTVLPMTTTARNNLVGAELWDGRLILNTTTDRINRYDLGTLTWLPVADMADVTALQTTINTALALKADLAAMNTALGLKADLAAMNTALGLRGNARIRSASAGVTNDSGVQLYVATGMTWADATAVVQTFTTDGFNNKVPTPPPKAITGGNGNIYWPNGTFSLGLPITCVIIDVEP